MNLFSQPMNIMHRVNYNDNKFVSSEFPLKNVPSELKPEQNYLEFDLSFTCKPSEKRMWKYQ